MVFQILQCVPSNILSTTIELDSKQKWGEKKEMNIRGFHRAGRQIGLKFSNIYK